MNATMLANTLRERADQVQAQEPRRELDFDNAELLRVLARVVEGKPLHKAFGVPGDWGYNTAIGKALASAPATTEVQS